MAQAPPVPKYDRDGPMGLIKHLGALEITAGRPDPFPTPLPLLCVGYKELGSKGKRCGKCLVTCYCSVECQREDWPARNALFKLNRKFELKAQTEEYLYCLNSIFGYYFDRILTGNEMGGERCRVLFEQFVDLGLERGKGVIGITVGILMILRAYKNRKKLAKLTGWEEEGTWGGAQEDPQFVEQHGDRPSAHEGVRMGARILSTST